MTRPATGDGGAKSAGFSNSDGALRSLLINAYGVLCVEGRFLVTVAGAASCTVRACWAAVIGAVAVRTIGVWQNKEFDVPFCHWFSLCSFVLVRVMI